MTQRGDAHLLKALDAASGRRIVGDRPAADWQAYAAALASARARVQAAPRCPKAVLRRAQGLFAARRPSLGAAVLRMVFDSWQTEAAPAYRGEIGPRTLRFEGRDAALDVRVATEADGRRRLQVAAEGLAEPCSVIVRAPRETRSRHLRLDGDASGQVLLPASLRAVEIEVKVGDAVVMRTPRLDFEEPEA